MARSRRPLDGTKVEVRAIREARAGSEEASREMLQKTEMREEVTPDRFDPGPEGQRAGRRFRSAGLDQIRRAHSAWLEHPAQDPERRGQLENIQGIRIEAASTNGGITGRGLSGAVEASTVNGGIQMDLDAVTGDTEVVTVNGGIMLSVAPGVNADLEATVVNGGVLVQDGLILSGDERSRQRVAGRIGSGGPRLVVQTTNGGVRVGLWPASGS